ncbi:hypothetical protein ACLK19_02470 [Escherichia coli]
MADERHFRDVSSLHKPTTQMSDFHVATHFNDDSSRAGWRKKFRCTASCASAGGDGFFVAGETQVASGTAPFGGG